MKTRQRGITLVELLMALTVGALLLGVGAPAMQTAVRTARVAGLRHHLTASLMTARAAAVARRHPVAVCPSVDGLRCTPGRWTQGWIVFDDATSSGTPAGPSAVLARVETVRPLGLYTSDGRPLVRYQPDGRASGTNVTFSICANATVTAQVIVNNAGRVRSVGSPARLPCAS